VTTDEEGSDMATGFKTVKPGTKFRVKELHGRDDDAGHIPAGSIVTVREYVGEDTLPVEGVAHVVVEYDRPQVAMADTENPEPHIINVPQAFGLTEDEFKSLLEPYNEDDDEADEQ
jgi:hypothetical protein